MRTRGARAAAAQFAVYAGARLVLLALAALPRSIGQTVGRGLGWLLFRLSPRHRRIARRNLEMAFGGDLDAPRRDRIARAAFAHLGLICADAAYFPRLLRTGSERLAVYEGVEHLRAAAALGRGLLVFSGHFGHWEMIALLQHRLGIPMVMVARPLENAYFDRFLNRRRALSGNRVIAKRNAARGVLRALRGGEAVAILIDQNVRGDAGVFVDFFGVPASTTPSLAVLAFKSGAPIVPVFSYPLPDGRWRIRYGEPIRARRAGSLGDDIRRLTAACTSILEAEVRRHPEWWLWMHDRWRTRPRDGDLPRARGASTPLPPPEAQAPCAGKQARSS